ncbi:MAG: type I-E CRISPR-associated protein Cas7/Cse4/CasC [Candidatus Sigynarchaeota archaeon]
MLLEIHILQNHAPSNLNRDDTGSPKSCEFGGVPRARISSQCLKHRIRASDLFKKAIIEAGEKLGIRTRELPELVKEKLVEKGIPEEEIKAAMKILVAIGKKEKKDEKGEETPSDDDTDEDEGEDEDENQDEGSEKSTSDEPEIDVTKRVKTKQMMFFSDDDIKAVTEIIAKEIKGKTAENILDKNANKRNNQLKRIQLEIRGQSAGITVDIALFGRMITSVAFRNVDAAIQVAHAISTNEMAHEFDFYTAVDDRSLERSALARQGNESKDEDVEESIEEDIGAGMMGDVEFTSACFYKYFSIDTDAFVMNLAGGTSNSKKTIAENLLPHVIKAFLNAAVLVSPTGKQNSFAAHQLPDAILIEAKNHKIPVSYANAFVKPCKPSHKQDLVAASIEALAAHAKTITEAYGLEALHRFWFSPRGIPNAWPKSTSSGNEPDDGVKQPVKEKSKVTKVAPPTAGNGDTAIKKPFNVTECKTFQALIECVEKLFLSKNEGTKG